MGAINPPSPLQFGPNSIANNLQNGELLPNGTQLSYNGLKNYIGFGNFENGLATGWSGTGCASLTNGLPTSVGTGGNAFSSSNGGRALGANTTAPAVVSSGQLDGNYSLNLATSGAGTIGDGYISQAYNISVSDQAKVLNISLSYKVVTGSPNLSGTSSNTYALAVYDLVNNAWLGSTGNFNFVQGTGVGTYSGTVQTLSTTVGLQLFIYSPVAPAAASALYLDNFFMGPGGPAITAPAMTDWVAYTPTFTGFGTPSGVNFVSRRVGDSLEVHGYFTTGTTTAVTSAITLGYNGANGNVVSKADTSGNAIVGVANVGTQSTTLFSWTVLASSSTNAVTIGIQSSTTAGTAGQNGSIIAGTGTVIEVNFSVGITGWSSNSVQSSDTLAQPVSMKAHASTGTAMGTLASSYSVVTYDVIDSDSTGSYTPGTGTYTIPISGYYDIAAQVTTSGTFALNGAVSIVINNLTTSAVISLGGFTAGGAITDNVYVPVVAKSVYLPAGNQIQIKAIIQGTYTSGAYATQISANYFSISRQTGMAVVQATESVNMRYSSSTTTIGTSATAITFPTKTWDTHSAYSGSTFTCPTSGKYSVKTNLTTGAITVATNAVALEIFIYHNGVNQSSGFIAGTAATSVNYAYNLADDVNCLAGDTIQIYALSNVSNAATAGFLAIERVGN